MNRTTTSWLVAAVLFVAGASAGLSACNGVEPLPPDIDAGEVDAGPTDAGGVEDAGETDAGAPDAGEADAGDADAGEGDAGAPDGGNGMDAGATDAGTSDGGGTDAGGADGGLAGVECGQTVCTGSDLCCGTVTDAGITFSCAAACQDAGVTLSCDGPEDCASGTPTCCGQMQTGMGTPPNCPVQSVTATCSATCTPNVPLACNMTAEIVRCHAAADCAGFTGYPQCCTFAQAQNAGYFCSSAFMATFASSCAP